MKIAILPGDGIGTEIVAEAVQGAERAGPEARDRDRPVGGAAYEAHGHPLPEAR
jgi:3-isopropylmalate dehydrogenase